MLGLPRRTSIALVGWLWADILLGLMALFLAANSAGTAIQAAQAIDPQPVIVEMAIDGQALLGGGGGKEREAQRIADEAKKQLDLQAKGRRVAIVLAYARHSSPASGDEIAKAATAGLGAGPFADAVVKTYHEIESGDRGSTLTLEVYLYQ